MDPIVFKWSPIRKQRFSLVIKLDFLFESMPGKTREGYNVGVFKDGQLKKMLGVNDSIHYLRDKQKKWKANKPKRECSEAQLANLAKGREIRERMREKNFKKGMKAQGKVHVKPKDSSHYKERNIRSSNLGSKKEKARVRKEKELNGSTSMKRMKKRNDSQRGLSSEDEYRQGENEDSE